MKLTEIEKFLKKYQNKKNNFKFNKSYLSKFIKLFKKENN